ncbi:DUF1559 domain-containing protein [Thalassoroseus pseudoceratinae]|uniref:DUF1559 domain-containing protein n=1 Tax=Thalassoroseus pseudoceratinae TaxID=2713176 RepID=UPI0014224C8D|nr:DUF1559 domain-containing protein [Thalassoroseus pseudoceratinae]
MSRRQTLWAWGGVLSAVALAMLFGVPKSDAQVQRETKPEPKASKTVAVAELLPQNAVIMLHCAGSSTHDDAWKATAAYEALYESGLMPVVHKVFDSFKVQAMQSMPPGAGDFSLFNDLYEHVMENGVSLAVALPAMQGPPLPYGVVVIPGAADLEPQISGFIRKASGGDLEFQETEVEQRAVVSATLPDNPMVEFGWWTEGDHLVATVGVDAVHQAVSIASKTTPNALASPVWKSLQAETADNVSVVSQGWFNFAQLRDTFGQMPIPNPNRDPEADPLQVNDVLAVLGVDNLGPIRFRTGFRGKAQWTEIHAIAPGPRKGLLAFDDQPLMSLDDLPVLPASTEAFAACSVDWSRSYDELIGLIRGLSEFGPPDAAAMTDGVLQSLPQIAGFDPKTEFADTFGPVACVYTDSANGIFGLGSAVAIQVKDADTLNDTLDHIFGVIREQTTPREFRIRTKTKHGVRIKTLEIGGGVFNPSYSIVDGWLVIGILPQSVEAFSLRVDGTLPQWEPNQEFQTAFEDLPKEFTSLVYVDPQKSVQTLAGFAPVILPIIKQVMGIQSAFQNQNQPFQGRAPIMDIALAELPPAELIAANLFPNLTVSTKDETGFHCYSRTSLPAIPLLGNGGGSGVAVAAVGVALILPAVQQARQAARRTQSKNNLKQLGLALHNYHDTFRHFPIGTHPNEDLKPEKRLSWIYDILPFIEQNFLFEQIKDSEAWDSENNAEFASSTIHTLINPGSVPVEITEGDFGVTNYVGIAGIGKDAATLPITDNRVGAFGYDRKISFRNITDGTSNTVGISEASGKIGPWAAGGDSTLRSFTKKPYINGPDGIGGPFTGGCNMMILDGSVRFISENIDPEVMEALSTIHGGEVIGDF